MSGFIFNCEKCGTSYDFCIKKNCPQCDEEAASYVEQYDYHNKSLDSGCVDEIVDNYQGFDCFDEFDESDMEFFSQ